MLTAPHIRPIPGSEPVPGPASHPAGVLPAQGRSDLPRGGRRTAGCVAAATSASVPALRRFARAQALRWALPRTVDGALELVVSELVGNAVRHSGSADVVLLLSLSDDATVLTVDVRDNGRWRRPRTRRPRYEDGLACGGRGLQLVEAYATRCRVRFPGGGTHVSVELALRY
ncbi:ATP-binding protein [Streptomyces sp. NPDC101191]|uniref:ATP-binding protein n=1 Tax=Streptomyces sp. NPDC101191 TaxID=3366126 RepID=UPI0037FBE66D